MPGAEGPFPRDSHQGFFGVGLTHYPDRFALCVYISNLSEWSKARLPGSGPRDNFAACVEWVLENNGLYFSSLPRWWGHLQPHTQTRDQPAASCHPSGIRSWGSFSGDRGLVGKPHPHSRCNYILRNLWTSLIWIYSTGLGKWFPVFLCLLSLRWSHPALLRLLSLCSSAQPWISCISTGSAQLLFSCVPSQLPSPTSSPKSSQSLRSPSVSASRALWSTASGLSVSSSA